MSRTTRAGQAGAHPMLNYAVRRLFSSLITLVLLVMALFWAIHALGSPVGLILGPDAAPEQYQALTHELGYDRPILVQFGDFLGKTALLDFGRAIQDSEPAIQAVMRALPKTLFLGALAFLISL